MAICVIISAKYANLSSRVSGGFPMRIGLLVYPGCMPAGLFAVADIFHVVNRRMGKPVFEPIWIGTDIERVSLSTGPVLEMEYSLHEPCDAYLLPGFWAETASDVDLMLERQSALIDWLRRVPKRTSLWTYCMGVALVAAAGRIDHCEATATWWLEHALRKRFTTVKWDFQQSVIEDHKLITAAGANGYWAVLSKLLVTRMPAEAARALAADVAAGSGSRRRAGAAASPRQHRSSRVQICRNDRPDRAAITAADCLCPESARLRLEHHWRCKITGRIVTNIK